MTAGAVGAARASRPSGIFRRIAVHVGGIGRATFTYSVVPRFGHAYGITVLYNQFVIWQTWPPFFIRIYIYGPTMRFH